MNGKSIILVTRTMDGKSESFTPGKNSAKKIAVKPGALYLLKNAADNFAPENITLKRVGKDLQVFNEGDDQPCLILTDYFAEVEGGERAPVLLGMAEDGQIYQYIPLSGEGYETGYLMADGQMAPVALGGQPMGAGEAFFAAQESDDNLWPIFLGLFALAGAVGGGIAIAHHNRDKNDSREPQDSTPPTSKGIGGALDNTGSKTGPLSSGDTTDETRPQLSGKGEPGSTITIYDNGTKIGETKVDGNGNWLWTPDKPLGEGKHELTTTETDKAGNVSDPSKGFEITVDTTAPEGSTTPPTTTDNVGDKTGPLTDGDYTDDTRPELSGKGEPGNTIDIWDNGKIIGSTTVDKDGNWTWQPEEPLTEGDHKLSTTETDGAGNTSKPSPDINIVVDTTPPTGATTPPTTTDNVGNKTGPLTSGEATDDAKPELSGKGEPGNTIDIWDNGEKIGSTTVDKDGNWTWEPEKPLPDGEHNLSTTETDKAGNTSEPSPGIDIVVDTTPPTGSTTPPTTTDDVGDKTGPLKNGEATDDTKPELSGKGDPGNTIDIWDNGEKIGSTTVDKDGNWTWEPETPLTEGEHKLSTTETDPAGNTSKPSPDITIVVDTTAPEGSTTPPTAIDDVGNKTGPLTDGGYTDDTQPELSGKGEPGNTIDIWDNGEKIGSTVVDENGNWTWEPETPLTEGEHKLSTTETDEAGNTSKPSPDLTINVDTTPPVTPSTPGATDNVGDKTGPITSGEATDDAQPELNGKGEPGNVVDIWDNGEKIGSTVVDENGNWTWQPETPLPDGEHNISTTETDPAGNTSEPSPGINIIVDTTPPDADSLAITGVNDTVGEITGNIENGGKTDDSRPTLSGTGTAGDTIVLYTTDASGKHEIGRATVDANGNWSIQPQSPLLAGENVFSAKEIDPAGNSITSGDYSVTLYVVGPDVPSIGAIVDNAGPETGPLQKGDVTDDNSPTVTGSAGAGDTVRIYDNGKLIGSTTADKDGNWSFTPGTALADGEHNITVTATDSVGQTSEHSGEFGFNIDTQAPETVKDLVAIDNEGDVQGPIENGSTTDDTTPTLGGTAEPGSTVNIYDDGKKIGEAQVDDNGSWSWTPDEALEDGSHSITVTVTDPAGNESGHSDELVINVDTTDPTAQITNLVDSVGDVVGNITPNGVTDDTKPQINGIAKANSIVKIYDGETLLGSTTSDADGKWSFKPETALSEGNHSLTVTATDPAGNTSQQSGAFVFEVDITSPTMPTIDGAIDDVGSVRDALANGGMTDDSTPTLHGSAEAGSIVTLYDGAAVLGSVKAGADGKWTFTPTTPLSEGEHRFTVTATDDAGNVSDKSAEFVLSTDYSAPDASKLAITGFADDVGEVKGNIISGGSTDDTMPVISGTGTAGDTITLYTTVNGVKTLLGSTTVGADGTWKLALTQSNALAGGVNQITAVETDQVGNSTSPTPPYVVTVYTAGDGPSTPSINTVFDDAGTVTGPLQKGSVTDDNTPTLKGNGEAGSTVRIYDNGVQIGSVTVGSDGSWTFTPSTALKDGTHAFTADSVNKVGQVSETSGAWGIDIDTQAPDAITDLVITDNVGDVQGELKDGDTTDDSTPTISGTAEPGSTVNIYDGERVIDQVEVGEDGKWTWTPDEALSEGDHNLSASVTDEAGNESGRTPGINITVDTSDVTIAITSVVDDVGSVTGNIARDGVTDDTTPTINGTGKAGSIVKIYDGSTLLGSTTVDASGKWSFTPSTALGEGKHTLTANATDLAGNVSDDVNFGFTIDTTAPTLPTIDSAQDDVGAIQGELAHNGVTDDPTPTLSGTAEAGSIVIISDGETTLGSVKAGADGKWTFTPTSTLSEGTHHFTVTATDAAGNVSGKSNEFTLTTDYTLPDTSKLAITGFEDNVGEVKGNILNGGSTDDTTPVITGTGTAGDTITVYTTVNGVKTLLGSTLVEADGTWKLALTESNALSGGVNQITAVESDPAGNSTSPTPAYVVTVYTAGDGPSTPRINTVFDDAGTVTGPLQKGSVTDDNTPTLKGNGEAGSTVRIYDNGKLIGSTIVNSDGSWTFTPSTALKDGTHAFTADSVNKVGQVSETSGAWGIDIDTQAPDAITDLVITDNVGDVQGELKDGDTTDDSTPTISGTAEPGSTVNIYDGERVIDQVEVGEDGKWSWTPDEALSEGDHNLSASVTDEAGNESGRTPGINITVDTSDVTIAITSVVDDVGSVTGNIARDGVTDDTTPTINGTGKAGSIVKIYDGSTLLGSTTVDKNGSWSFTPDTALGEGKHTLTANATDLAGNVSGDVSFGFTIDTTAPTVPTIDGAHDDVGAIQGSVAHNGVTDDPTPTLSGTAEAGSIVIISDGETTLGSVKAGADGKWTFTPTSTLSEGTHHFTVTATDAAGNVSGKSNEFTLTTDYSAPDASKLAITGFEDNVGEVTGNVANGGSTDDTTPVITGTGTAGDTITVYTTLNGTKILLGSTTVGADGSWKLAITDSNALAAGTHTLTAVESDPAGNSTSPTPGYTVTVVTGVPAAPSINTVVDDAGSVTGTLQKGAVTDDSTPTLKGSAGAGAVVRIYDNGKVIGSTTADKDGNWTFTPSTALKDGSHVFTADVVTSVGQSSEKSGDWNLSIDTAAPNPVDDLKITDNVGDIQGEIKDGDTTDDSTPTFEGTAEPGSTVNIYDGKDKIGTATVGEDGKWTWTPDESLGEGEHNLSVSVTDEAGNESGRTPGVNITVDTSEVTIAITNVVDDIGTVTGNIARDGVTDDTMPTINGTGKAGSIVKIYDGSTLLGSTTVDKNGSWSFTPDTALGEGKHTLTANATDLAGNVSGDVSFGFTIDTTAPTVPTIDGAHDDVGAIQGSVAHNGVTDDPTPTLSGTAEAGSIVIISDGETTLGSVKAGADGKWTFTPTSTLSEGTHHFTVTATDAAGNVSGKSNEFTLTTDYSAPDASKLAITGFEDNVGEVTGNVANGGSTDDTTPVITGTGTAGDTITVYTTLNGTKILLGSTTVGADGSWKLAITDSNALAAGTHTLTAVESDPAGNSTSPTPGYTVTVVTGVPAAPSINTVVDDAGSVTGTLQKGAVTDDSTPTLKGSAGAGAVVRIYDNGKVIGSTTADKDGNWTFTPSTALKDGSHVFTADVVTSVGQSSEKSGDWNLSIDTAAPNPVDDLKITDNVGDIQGEIKDGDTTDDSTPTFEGTAEPGSTVNIYDGKDKIGTATVGEDGKWTWTPDESLGEGEHNLSVSVTDEAGNESGRTPGVNITVDTSEVTIAITNVVDDIGTVTGNIARDGVTDDTMPTINGTGKAGSIVKIYDGSTLLGSTTVDKNGSWSFTPDTALGEGKHTLTANATDLAGNVSGDVSFGFTIDTTAPTVPTIDGAHDDVGAIQGSVAHNGVTDDPTPTLSGTAEAGSIVIISDGETTLGSVKAGADGKWTFTPTSTLSEGTHHFTVTATDAAGNVSGKSNEFTLTTDYSAPDASKLAITGFADDVGEVKGNVESGGSTDDTMPVISGTGTEGDTITVSTTINGTTIVLGSTTVGADGKWTLQIDADHALSSGTHALTAVETDPAGNSTKPSSSYTVTVVADVPAAPSINTVVDDYGSVTGQLQKGAVTDDSTPTLKGSAGAGMTIRIYDNGTLIGSTTADSNGNWTFTPGTALKDGSHSFTADAVDSVGQVSNESGDWAISIDTQAPDAIKDLTLTDDVGAVTGVIKNGDTTDDATPTFSGSAEPGSTVNIYDGDNKIGSVTVGEDGKWSWTPETELADGDHSLSASVTDEAGNESARTPSVDIKVDTADVNISISYLVDDVGTVTGNLSTGSVTDDVQPEIVGKGKAGSIVKIYDGNVLLGSTTVGADGTWRFTSESDLSEGAHTIKARATDGAGNVSEDAVFTITIDTKAPSAPTIDGAHDDVGAIQGNVASGGVTDDPTPTLSGTAEAGSLVSIYDGETKVGSVKADASGKWSWTPTTTLAEGSHNFTVTATDAAGNVSGESNEYNLTTDYTAPDASKLAITGYEDDVGVVTGNIASGSSTDDTMPVITGTGTAGDTITVYSTLNGNKVVLGTATVDANGKWSLAVDADHALATGTHALTAVETDPAGNSTNPSAIYTVTVVGDVPAAPSINTLVDDYGTVTGELQKGAVTDDSTPTLKGSAGAGMTIRIYDNGVEIGSTTADNNGNWAFTPSTTLPDGSHAFSADAVNTVGQVSEKSGEWSISIDTAAPSAITDMVITDNVGEVTGPIASGDTTDDNTPTLSGSAEANSIVTIYDGITKIGSTTADSNGKWSWTPETILADGKHSLSVSAKDAAGNESDRTAVVDFTVDTANVTISITSVVDDIGSVTGNIAANGVTDDTMPTINGSGKAGSTVKVYDGDTLLGSTTVTAGGTWSFTPTTALKDGAHTIKVNATDAAGKTSEDVNFSFTVDTEAPTLPTIDNVEDDVGSIQGPLANNGVTDDPTPTLSGKAEAGSLVTVYDGEKAIGSVKADSNGNWNWTTPTLTAGEHKFTVTATDTAGNVSGKSDEFVLTTDYTAPDGSKLAITGFEDSEGAVTGNIVSGGSSDDKQPVISGTGTAGDTITLYTTINNVKTLLGTTTVDANGTWKLALDSSNALSEGLNSLSAVESDPAGNATSPSPAYVVTIVPTSFAAPTIDNVDDNAGKVTGTVTNGASTDDTTPTLSGSAEANSTIIIYNGDTRLGQTTSDSSGKWSWTVTPALAEGDYSFNAKAQSSAGVISDASNTWNVTIDTTAPNPVADLTITDDVGDYTGPLFDGDTTDDSTPTLSGTAEAGSTVTIYNGSSVLGTVTVKDDGSWNWTPSTALKDATYAFAVTVTDAAGNTSASTPVANITVDTLAPQVTLAINGYQDNTGTNTGLMTNNNGTTDEVNPVLTGSWTGDLQSSEVVRIYQDGVLLGVATVDRNNHTWTYAVKGLENTHKYSFTATAVDAAGNETAVSPEFSLTIDLDAPTQTVTIVSYTDDVGAETGDFGSNTTTDDRNPELNGKVSGVPLEEGEVVRIYDATTNTLLGTATVDASTSSWTFKLPALEDDKTYTFKAVVADEAGNEGPVSNDFTVSVDLTVVVNAQTTEDTTPIISGSTGFEIGEGEYVVVEVNGKTYSSKDGSVVVDPRNNTWYVQLPDADALKVGTYDVRATLHSANGAAITSDDTLNELVVASSPKVTVGTGASDSNQKATAVTIGEDGVWRIHSNQSMLDATGTSSSTLGDFAVTKLVSNSGAGYSGTSYVQNATFIDYNRDGYMDLFAVDSEYNDGQQMFYYNGSSYAAYQVGALTNSPQTGDFAGNANTANSANTWSWYGGIVAIDKNGDGYVDLVYGDQTPNDSGIRGGYGSQIVLNNNGTVAGMNKDGTFATDYATDASHRPIGLDQSQPDMELSGVDINNDGIVDFVMHSQNIVADGSRVDKDGATNSTAAISTNQARLVVVTGTNNGTWNVTQVVDNVFQRGNDSDPNIGNGVAMTWADYNGDGYMDLFLGRGSASNTQASGAANNAGEYASRIYFNDGTGKLVMDDPNNDGIGNPTASGMYTFNDNIAGGASLAVDWNGDGKMDVIEMPGMYSTSGGVSAAATKGAVNLYTNTTTGSAVSFDTTNLLTQVGMQTIGSGTTGGTQVTGGLAIDIDWDGDRDLLVFTNTGNTTYIENTNKVAYGTSIHLRIVDAEGINTLYGNTVQLIDESTGKVVSTQSINPQSGNQTNDSSAIVDFYGLDATKTYSAVILRSANKVSADVGGVATVGSNTIEIVNKAWSGLKAEEANHAYVLTTESETNVANASSSGGTNSTGIVGTGYNDTFFATLGNDLYNGGGGTTTISGVKSWSNTGGLDIVDYKLAGSTALTIDLNNKGMQSTGFGSAQFVNIEGIAGGNGDDKFTGNAADNQFEGRGGNDTFILQIGDVAGGQDTLMYKVLAATNNGGNGQDTVQGFHVGTIEATKNADIIDISELLVGYQADADGAAHYINGKATMDAGETISKFLQITHSGSDTILSIDRDGTGSAYGMTALVTLKDTNVDLETLLANHQITLS